MTSSSSPFRTRALCGALVGAVLFSATGCGHQDSSSTTATDASAAPAASAALPASASPGAAGGDESFSIPSAPSETGPDTTPSMSPEMAANFSAEAEAGGIDGKPVDPRTLSATELQFGRPPGRDPNVTYQPDVLIMEHGDTALRSMESNGIIWHFDPNAPQVDQISAGKIIYATERCVGRVGAVTRTSTDVAVTLEPVQLTDIIQKGHFIYNQPLDLSSVVAAPIPDVPVDFRVDGPAASPGASPSGTPQTSTTGYVTRHLRLTSVTYAIVGPGGRWAPFRFATYDARGHIRQHYLQRASERVAQAGLPGGLPPALNPPHIPAPPPVLGNALGMQQVDIDGMAASPCLFKCGGLGIELKYDDHGLSIDAFAIFYLNRPNLNYNVDIDLSGIKTAAIWLNGMGGFKTAFVASSHEGFEGNIHAMKPIPLDLTIPINYLSPIGVHFNADLVLSSGFSAKTGVLSSSIDLQLCCQIYVGYHRGSGWSSGFPQFDAKTTQGNVSGVSVGINSLLFGMRQQLLVGLGFAGFATGPYVGLNETMTALKQSSTTTFDCRQATVDMTLDAGVGYTIPSVVTKVINVFLSLVNAAPLPSHGSLLKMGQPAQMAQWRGSLPKHCAGT